MRASIVVNFVLIAGLSLLGPLDVVVWAALGWACINFITVKFGYGCQFGRGQVVLCDVLIYGASPLLIFCFFRSVLLASILAGAI